MASLFFHLAIIIAALSLSRANLSDDYNHFAALDPDEKVKLYWSVDEDTKTVSFAVDGATTGWVGFGISTGQGKMNQADMVIGWVKNGKAYLTDRYGVGHYPKFDDHNDYNLISGEENNGHTILKFSRKIDTCDDQDRKIQEGTTKVIFSLYEQDPESPTQVMKHSYRGARSLMLLNQPGKRDTADPSWSSFVILNRNNSVPSKDTTYHCSVHKVPEFKEKQHIVRVAPVVQPGNEGVVHHMLVTVCDDALPDHLANVSYVCDDKANMPWEVMKCRSGSLVAVWAIGAGPFNFPSHVGFPIGSEYMGKHFVMEMHYDNPDKRSGIFDSSGFRIYHTPKLRQYDSGIWSIGVAITPWMMIPPQQEAWKTTGYCMRECSEKLLMNSSLPGKGIKLFALGLHTHLAGRAVWTQHVDRDGVELPEIARDNNYDCNFQDLYVLKKEIHFKPGDNFIQNCIYNTMGRTEPTYGGESTREEMCLNFLYYYPLIKSIKQTCHSLDLRAGTTLIKKYNPSFQLNVSSLNENPVIQSNLTWIKQMTDDYRMMIDKEARVLPSCDFKRSFSLEQLLNDKYQLSKVKITTPLPKPKDECKTSAATITSPVFYQVLALCLVLFAL